MSLLTELYALSQTIIEEVVMMVDLVPWYSVKAWKALSLPTQSKLCHKKNLCWPIVADVIVRIAYVFYDFY